MSYTRKEFTAYKECIKVCFAGEQIVALAEDNNKLFIKPWNILPVTGTMVSTKKKKFDIQINKRFYQRYYEMPGYKLILLNETCSMIL